MNPFSIYYSIITLLSLTKIYSYYIPETNHNITTITSFAFGSCYNLKKSISKYTIFNEISKTSPDVFLWLGDAAYVRYAPESKHKLIRFYKQTFNIFSPFNRTRVLRQYNNTKYSPDYFNFQKTHPIIGVWDDNDYGQNDGNGHFPYKDEMKEIFLDFLDEPSSSIRRTANRPIYATYVFGDVNSHKNIRVILLDVRYNKSRLIDRERDILGEEQWKWFEDVLTNANETFILIASGTQILPIDRLFSEAWFPESRIRLFKLIEKTKKEGIVLLTGDIHNGQILRTPCIIEGIGYHLYEITSSGLGHYCKPKCDIIIDYILPRMYKFTKTLNYYNYAQLYFNWGNTKEESSINVNIIDIDGKIRTNYTIGYNMLKRNDVMDNNKGEKCYNMVTKRFNVLNVIQSYYKDIYDNWEEIKMYVIGGVIFTTCFAMIVTYLLFKLCFIKKK